MPAAAAAVRPGRWTNRRALFDNGWYSVIAGDYLNGDRTTNHDCLGGRWNGGKGNVGFPIRGGDPLWHVVPDFLRIPILTGLLTELAENPDEQVRDGNFPAGAQAAA